MERCALAGASASSVSPEAAARPIKASRSRGAGVASSRTRPDASRGRTEPNTSTAEATWPAIRSWIAGPSPRYSGVDERSTRLHADFGHRKHPQFRYFTSHNEIGGKNSSNKVRSVSLIRKGTTPR